MERADGRLLPTNQMSAPLTSSDDGWAESPTTPDRVVLTLTPEQAESSLAPVSLTSAQGLTASPAANIVVSPDKHMPLDSTRRGAGLGSNDTRIPSASAVALTRRSGPVVDGTRHRIAAANAEGGGRKRNGTRPEFAAPLGSVSIDDGPGHGGNANLVSCAGSAPAPELGPGRGSNASLSKTAGSELAPVGAGRSSRDTQWLDAGAVTPSVESGHDRGGDRYTPAGPDAQTNDDSGLTMTGAHTDNAGVAALLDLGPVRTTPDARSVPDRPGTPDGADAVGLCSHVDLAPGADLSSPSEIGPGHTCTDIQKPHAGSEGSAEEAEVGHTSSDAHTLSADLDLLHATLGHYARMLADVQKQRIAQGNRVDAMRRDGLPEEWIAPAIDALEHLAKLERSLNAYLGKQAKRHFMAPWILAPEQKGIGLPGFARLLGITGPIDQFATVSKLWRYLGLAVDGGHAPRRQKGVKLNYSPQGRVLCHQLGESIVKMGKGGEYRTVYDTKRADYFARERLGESGCPTGAVHKTKASVLIACVKTAEDGKETSAHIHAMARRYAVKRLMRRLWIEWRRRQREMADAGTA